MRVVILALAAVAALSPALASDKTDVTATVTKFNDEFNKGNADAAAALCTPQAHIIDDFAPYEWQSANTCVDWAAALTTYDKKNNITGEMVTVGKPWRVAVTGDRGYVVYPVHYSYKLKGKPVIEQGVWTLALQKLAVGWRIKSWSWAQH